MLRTFKTIIIATAILSLFFLFLTSSEAFEISQMYPSYGGYEDHTGYLYHTAYVETDSPYLFVYWYVDDVYQSVSGGPSTDAYFSPNPLSFPGSSDGTTYTIEAVAYQYDAENNLMLSDTSSYSVTVYAACRKTAASLTASIESCGWNGRTASASAKGTIEHTGGKNAPSVNYLFKFTFKVLQLQGNGRVKANVYIPPVLVSPLATIKHGDAKLTKNYSDTYTLGNGWRINDRFKVETELVVWAKNTKGDVPEETCRDSWSEPLTLTNQ